MGIPAWLKTAEVGAGIITSAKNIHESRQNRRFQRDMSNTAHQREMADLKKAGLNPLLTGKYGGASTPGGSTASLKSPAEGLTSDITSAKQQKAGERLINNQINKVKAETDNINVTTAIMEAKAKLEFDEIISRTDREDTTSAKNRAEKQKLMLEIDKLKVTRLFYQWLGDVKPTKENMKQFLDSIKKTSDVPSGVIKNPKKPEKGFGSLKFHNPFK